jgi:uncharacterized protein
MTAAVIAGPRRTGLRGRRALAALAALIPLVMLAAYLGIAGYTADRLSHPARQTLVDNPARHGLTYTDVEFPSAGDGIRLSGWLVGGPGRRAILMLHGRDQTRDRDEAFLLKAADFVRQGYAVLMFDFRAHGLSGGDRYGLGAWETRDVAGALTFLEGRGYQEFGAYGVSMGAAIALLSAPAHPEIRALMVDSPYADLPALLEKRLPEASGLPAFFNPGLFFMAQTLYGMDLSGVKPVVALAHLGDRPVFLVQSRDGDSEVPVSDGLALAQAGAADPNFTFWRAPGSGHVHSYTNNPAEYLSKMDAFYARYLP